MYPMPKQCMQLKKFLSNVNMRKVNDLLLSAKQNKGIDEVLVQLEQQYSVSKLN